MAVSDRTGRFFDVKPLTIGALQHDARCRAKRAHLRQCLAQRADSIGPIRRHAQRRNFVDVLAGRRKSLPAGQALGGRVDVGHAGPGIGTQHGIANRLQRQAHQLFFFKQLVFDAFALGDVGNLYKHAAHHRSALGRGVLAIEIGHVGNERKAFIAARVADGALKHLPLAEQRSLDVRARLVKICAQQVFHRRMEQRIGGHTKVALIGLIGKTVALVTVPIGNHRGQVVQNGTHIVLGLLQPGTNALARSQLAHKQHRQTKTREHQRQRKTTQLPSAAAPLRQDGIGGLRNVDDQRIGADVAEGVEVLDAINRRRANKNPLRSGLQLEHRRRTRKTAPDISAVVRKPRQHNAIAAKQIGTAAGTQVQRAQQVVEISQPQRHHHHTGKVALLVKVGAAQRQDKLFARVGTLWLADIQPLVRRTAVCDEIVGRAHVDLLAQHTAAVQHDVAMRIADTHRRHGGRAQRMVKQHLPAQMGWQNHHIRQMNVGGQPHHRAVQAVQRARHAFL